MKITTFNNMKALIHGNDLKRIGCDRAGVLKIGKTEITISPDQESILPLLFNGGSGTCNASFTDSEGKIYDIEMVGINGGRIVPPSSAAIEVMELRCRVDAAEKECDELREEIRQLRNIFDTNSLNFLIN